MSVATFERGLSPDSATPEGMPKGIAFSATLHAATLVLIALGLPTLFHRPPPEEMPIAVQLVTIAPDTKATRPNPYRPKPEAATEAPVAPPVAKPEPKPEPKVEPAPPPPAAEAPPPAPQPPAPKPLEVQTPPPPAPQPPPPKPEAKLAPPPPAPKPLETRAPQPPKPEPKPRPEARKPDAAAFDAMLKTLADKKPDPANFDSLLKNLTHQPTAPSDEPPRQRPRQTAAAAPSSQPRAPLGSQLTANEMDLVREQIARCWNVPTGVRDAKDLVVEIRVFANPDGSVRDARIVDQGRMGDPLFRAAAESARRAFGNPQCTPLRLPAGKYEMWKEFVVDFSPKDLL